MRRGRRPPEAPCSATLHRVWPDGLPTVYAMCAIDALGLPATISVLFDPGAASAGIVLSPDDPKPPSPEVAALLRTRGIPDEEAGGPTGR